MRTFTQKPKASQQTTSAKSTLPARTHFGQSREVTSFLHLQRTIGNQAVQRLLQTGAGELGEASSSLASPRFGHDFSRIPVNGSWVRARTAPEELASLRSRDMEGREGAEGVDQEGDVPIATPSPAPPATQPAQAPGPVAALNITVPTHVRSASTPAGMPDRIPPRVDTPATVGVTGWHAPWQVVRFSVEGAGGGNGSVTINGANSVDLVASATIQLRGVNQTAPGNAGNLRLVAHQGTVRVAQSSGFTVSSVPQNWSTSLVRSFTGPAAIGMVALNSWQSDSGNVADLDEVRRKEQVQVTTKTGPYAGAVQGVSSWRDATLGAIHDHHRDSPRASFRALGSKIAKQVFIFKCARTAVTDIPARNSGLVITRNITSGGTGIFNYDISKVGTAVTANGFASAAASGSAVAPTQVV